MMKTRGGTGSILVGDIGGTRTRLSLYDGLGKRLLLEAVLPSREHGSFEEIARSFLGSADHPPPSVAVLGVAGPIRDGVATVTNLSWKLDEGKLARSLSLDCVVLANDLAVAARGCLHLPADVVVPLGEGRPKAKGNHMAVIAAGTGLGEALLVWDGSKHLVLPTEGGHTDFAAQGAVEAELCAFLSKRFPEHVSYERVLSGNGLGALYDFFVARGARETKANERRLEEGDRNATIAELGLSGASRPAAKAVDLFASIYGAEAGNLALKLLGLGGVFVAGNIARHIVLARREQFLAGFRKKGRFSGLMAQIPVVVVTDPLVGVRGALAIAKDLVADGEAPPARPKRATSRKRSSR
ncbi:glucokinase [Polyangium sorediatum]|uniref:Glucokinase n=1 Tax=Polyangium sorediatum TaxID=889274 RepID=A0ABT6P7L6_9BACT|nr:glucokinase [Polyangium sorediatum]MDI1436605.1 glucokinase [Polyangium sorediatum]